jgi:putative intracellular protease/amidase
VLNHRKADAAGMAGGVVNALGSPLIIPWLSQKYIGNELLRVSIVEGEPGGLDLDHQAMTVTSGRLVTGTNPQSGRSAAERIVRLFDNSMRP